MEGKENKPQDDVSIDEGKIERVINANLLTNYETTMAFMEAIEHGESWLRDQPKGAHIKHTLDHVMDWLKGNKENSESHLNVITLYGWQGTDRYYVYKDGSVKFIPSFGSKETLAMAKGIGFPLEEYLK